MVAVPQQVAARQSTTQQTNYIRKTVNFNDAGIGAPTNPFAKLPQGAQITNIMVDIETAFNAGTTNVLTVGTTTASANEVIAAGDVDETAVATTKITNAALGGSIARSADIFLYAKYAQTGGAATAGKAHICIEFIPNNDG